ncbi:DNA repair protein XRCC1 [Cricetulus griseus]|uniref:DNA repair protein XRCC1 n=1 Tax=Cricetulus griseus TaxID=10029 RepID=A0A061HXT5_CRIGR|nr:DNA repair protein XRCC1 [Cricetulus griseus]
MSPSESRSGSNPNRVRMFGPDKLVRAAAEKRWDRVKIVCSQPYSKDSPYGLSFVRFHSPPDKDEAETPSQKGTVTKLGQFRVKEEDDGASSLKPGALFFSRINKTSSVTVPSRSPAAAAASTPAQKAAPGKPREGTEPRGARAGPQELGKILQGVVVVLSGFQNPFRSELRDKALELGAKYRPDWTPDSTHLM